jgi:hypothetical protein
MEGLQKGRRQLAGPEEFTHPGIVYLGIVARALIVVITA